MVCQICKKEQATIHIQEVIGAAKTTLHLCNACAEKNQLTGEEDNGLKLAALAYQLATDKLKNAQISLKRLNIPDATCPNCGMTADEFHSTGRFGCARCYEAFREILEPMIERMHRGTHHRGTAPRTMPDEPAVPAPDPVLQACGDQTEAEKVEVDDLRKQLTRAVDAENYERAAELRDQILQLVHPDGTVEP